MSQLWAKEALTNSSDPRIDFLNVLGKRLVAAGAQPDELRNLLIDEIRFIESRSGRRVVMSSTNEQWFDYAPSSWTNRAEVTTTPIKSVRILSAKIDGVTVSVNLFKPGGKYNHDNSSVASALRQLADLVENSKTRLADHDLVRLMS